MIRHRKGDEFLLITQDDHARFSGELARHLGNAMFSPPSPSQPTIQACGLHDAGWPLHDEEPTLNAKGEPTHVFETPAEVVTRVWGESARRAAETGGPYCGLLVSLHVLNLSLMAQRGDLGNEMNTTDAHARFAVNKFQHAQIERQEEFRKTLGMRLDLPLQGGLARAGSDPAEDELRFNFGYLRLTDAISLDACCSNEVFQALQGVHKKPGATPVSIEFAHPAPFTIKLKPWPFNVGNFQYEIPCRRLPATPLANLDAFREAYKAAPVERVSLKVWADSRSTEPKLVAHQRITPSPGTPGEGRGGGSSLRTEFPVRQMRPTLTLPRNTVRGDKKLPTLHIGSSTSEHLDLLTGSLATLRRSRYD